MKHVGLSILAAWPRGVGSVLLWCAALTVAIVVFGVAVQVLRKKFHPGAQPPQEPKAFSLEYLERMRDTGQISSEEFRRLRRTTFGLDPAGDEPHNASSSGGGKPDDEEQAAE